MNIVMFMVVMMKMIWMIKTR